MTDSVLDSPNKIVTHYFDNVADAAEAVQAAERLSLGVTLRNRTVPDESGESEVQVEEWVIDIYDAPPAEPADAEDDEAAPTED